MLLSNSTSSVSVRFGSNFVDVMKLQLFLLGTTSVLISFNSLEIELVAFQFHENWNKQSWNLELLVLSYHSTGYIISLLLSNVPDQIKLRKKIIYSVETWTTGMIEQSSVMTSFAKKETKFTREERDGSLTVSFSCKQSTGQQILEGIWWWLGKHAKVCLWAQLVSFARKYRTLAAKTLC